ncbi:hypothetical protein P7C73_g5043, partial [Tremellales sp. Uapishka_1]
MAVNQSLATFVLPLLPAGAIPPLPRIGDPDLERTAASHTSLHGANRRGNSLVQTPGQCSANYEKLEHVGDSILGSVVTCLLQDLMPDLNPGPATMLKSHLVNNNTLAQIAVRYGLPNRLLASSGSLAVTRTQTKTQASLFEAYVAASYYAFLTEPDTKRTHGDAYEYIGSWLRELFSPLAHWALNCMRAEEQRLNDIHPEADDEPPSDDVAAGSTAKLNEFSIRHLAGAPPEYIATEMGIARWQVRCITVSRKGGRWEAEATRSTKKAAMTVAAWKICEQIGLI